MKPFTIETVAFSDDRGVFSPFFDPGKYKELSQLPPIKRIYYVYNHQAGVIRGFHYHEKEWKIFYVVSGGGKFVAINPDNSSEVYSFVASERKPSLIIIPPQYANGWMSLEDKTIVLCASNLTTDESIQDDKRFDPYNWGDIWSVKSR